MKRLFAASVLGMTTISISAQGISGTVLDEKTKEPLMGAIISLDKGRTKVVTDIDGNFKLSGLGKDKYSLMISYVGYKTQNLEGFNNKETDSIGKKIILMQPDEQVLDGITVVAMQRKNNHLAMVQMTRTSPVIVSNISAQDIKLSQDANAGEVIHRVPGVSLIDDKFVMVRGLSQRYNNVWINGGAVPSSEADSRAFSFDIIPGSQIDNLTVVKSPSAEYPADYSGGFIMVNTKDIPTEKGLEVSVGANINDATHFNNFNYSKGSSTDFLGMDGGLRSLSNGINTHLKTLDGGGVSLLGNQLNNDWKLLHKNPWGDFKLSAAYSNRWQIGGRQIGVMAALNYSDEYRTYDNMQNNLFGIYDAYNDRSNYLRYSVDDQYNHNNRLGMMLNLTYLSKEGKNKYQLKNIFNQIGNSRYTWREGISAQANQEHSAEYYYRSRTTYNGQLTGKHTFDADALDWSVGYAYANRHLPDRRRYLIDDALENGKMALSTGNDVSREWTQLDEHIFSANINNKHDFIFGEWSPSVKFGAYGEYRTRKYTTREFIYNWNVYNNTMPQGFQHSDIPTLLSDEQNMGVDKLYLLEQMHMHNNYRGHNTLGAGYVSLALPLGDLSVNAGVRFEHNDMELISNTRDDKKSESSRHYIGDDLFPSLNMTYKLDKDNQLRLSYGKSINRPEFRELSSSVYYDFDLASSVQGNTELKNCYVHNVDLRYELYPSKGEMISLAAFYKHFDSPIEWTYTVAGGTDLIYYYKNAKSADNYGLELDIRKDLSFIGLQGFSWSFNGALIKSKVKFEKGAKEQDRPMQGQSPYLVNTGLFYRNTDIELDAALLYNRIGKRIIGVGRSEGSTGSDENARVPDSYEMPRNSIDLSVSKRWGKHWETKLSIRDVLAEKVYYKQFADVTYADGSSRTIEQVTRCYRPGRNIGIQAVYKF